MLGESIALLVAVLWTTGAIFGELAGKRLGALPLNVIRMVLTLIILGLALFFMVGHPYPYLADCETWLWLSLSGLLGFGFGDYCLFNSYVLIGSRFSQLFMTLAAPFAAISAWMIMGERISLLCLLGMIVTLTGISVCILGKGQGTGGVTIKLPIRGIIFGIGAALGQGVGLVLSKVGLEHYTASAPLQAGMSPLIYPVAGTMIRALTGLGCFLILLIMKKKVGQLKLATQDGRGMHYAFWATLLGPAVGVSLSLMAIQYTSTGIAQTLMSLTPVLIIWPSYIIFKSKVTAQEVLGAIIAVCGAILFFI